MCLHIPLKNVEVLVTATVHTRNNGKINTDADIGINTCIFAKSKICYECKCLGFSIKTLCYVMLYGMKEICKDCTLFYY